MATRQGLNKRNIVTTGKLLASDYLYQHFIMILMINCSPISCQTFQKFSSNENQFMICLNYELLHMNVRISRHTLLEHRNKTRIFQSKTCVTRAIE